MINNYDTVTLMKWAASKVDDKSCDVWTAKIFPVSSEQTLKMGKNLVGDLKPSNP